MAYFLVDSWERMEYLDINKIKHITFNTNFFSTNLYFVLTVVLLKSKQ